MPRGKYTRTLERFLVRALKEVRRQLSNPCTVDGCENLCGYGRTDFCEKHYYRIRRTGTTVKERKFTVTHHGYILENGMQGHPLANKDGSIYQHRRVLYDKIGAGPHECYWCGAPIDWDTLHSDHVDSDGSNNDPENLVPACALCNHQRGAMIAFLKRCEAWKAKK
jgi:hypothetical protein